MEFDKVFEISDKFFRYCGVNVNYLYERPTNTSSKENGVKFLKDFYYILIFINYLASIVILLIFISDNIGHISEIFECVILTGVAVVYSSKSFNVWIYQNKIRKLKSRLRKIHVTTESSKYLQIGLNTFLNVEKFSLRILMTAMVAYIFNAILLNLLSDDSERILVFKVYIPFDYQPLGIFICVLIWQSWASLTSCLHEISTCGILHGLIIILASEFQMIGDAFRKFDYNKGFEHFKTIIKKYQELIEVAEDLESIFSFSNLVTFIGSILQISFIIIECFNDQNQPIRYIVFVSFLVIMLNNIFFLCFFCQKLETASVSVAEKLAETSWYETRDKKTLMAIRFTMMRSQKPINLTAAKFTIMNLNTFKNVRNF